MRHRNLAIPFTLLLIAFLARSSQATVIYSEDFEGLADGNLAGQGGWTGDAINLSSVGTHLPSRVVNGFDAAAPGIQAYERHPIDIASAGPLIEVSFDAWANSSSQSPPSQNSGLTLAATPSNFNGVGWDTDSLSAASNGAAWRFFSRAAVELPFYVYGGHDDKVRLSVLLDKPHGEVFGRYVFYDGLSDIVLASGETPHFSRTAAEIDALASLFVWEDFRGGNYRGIEVDNIRVESVPEPSTITLLGLGAIGCLGFAWRRRTTWSR